MGEDSKTTFVLAILDGWGFSQQLVGNPIKQAHTPTIDYMIDNFPMTLLQASGLAVGMAWGEAGNSEVGHLNIGAGRIVEQYYSRINRSIKNGSFFENQALADAFNFAKKYNSNVHLVGLLTSGTVHAAFPHVLALIEMAAKNQWPKTFLHLFLDGRDSGLQEGAQLLEKLKSEIAKSNSVRIATIIGRDFSMDRDNNWDRTQKAYDLIVKAEGERFDDPASAVSRHYENGVNDSAMSALVANDYSGITDNDAIIFFNFREDSMRQMLTTFVDPEFARFTRAEIKNIYVSSMTRYLDKQTAPVAFFPPEIKNSLAEVLSAAGKSQLHVAESEKYAHVTYFFNALIDKPFDNENDLFVESVKNIESNPTMSSDEIAEKVNGFIDNRSYDFIVLNFANADLLAHTGNYDATVLGVEAVDRALAGILSKVSETNSVMIITADHGNAESLIYRVGGEAETKHDDNPVALYLVANKYKIEKNYEHITQDKTEINGILPDVAPTILELMNIPQPAEMTGQSLLPVLLKQR